MYPVNEGKFTASEKASSVLKRQEQKMPVPFPALNRVFPEVYCDYLTLLSDDFEFLS